MLIIREAILENEVKKVKLFLKKFDLTLENDVKTTLYIESNDEVIGTISSTDYIIKDLAIDKAYQSENLASKLVNEIIQKFIANKIYSYQLFTKPIYKDIFTNLNFKVIVQTDKVVMLEGGLDSIEVTIQKLKKQLEIRFATLEESSDIACLVINGNPFTIGHEYLVEVASKNHKMVVVFIVEENKSTFTFEERFSMAYLACKQFDNVYVMPSTKYIISALTFPSYFLNDEEKDEQLAKIDALIFNEYFNRILHFKKRYVGTEIKPKMQKYNETLKAILKDSLIEIPRYIMDNQIVSATYVRKCLENKDLKTALKYIPRSNFMILSQIARKKYDID